MSTMVVAMIRMLQPETAVGSEAPRVQALTAPTITGNL